MATRSEQRAVWMVVGGLGLAIIIIELFLGRSLSLSGLCVVIGLAAMIAGFLNYRALAPRRRKLLDD